MSDQVGNQNVGFLMTWLNLFMNKNYFLAMVHEMNLISRYFQFHQEVTERG